MYNLEKQAANNTKEINDNIARSSADTRAHIDKVEANIVCKLDFCARENLAE